MRCPARLASLLLVSISAIASTPYQAVVRYPDLPADAYPRVFATDAAGNVFIVSYVGESSGYLQIHVLKSDPQGKTLGTIQFGASSVRSFGDGIAGAAIDPKGNLVIAGSTSSRAFPLVAPLLQTNEEVAAFVIKIDPQLKNILFSTKLGGTRGRSFAGALTLDRAGDIYLTGSTTDGDFPVTPGAFQEQPPLSNRDGTARYSFLTKIRSDSPAIVFSTYYGDSPSACTENPAFCAIAFGVTDASAIALDAAGNVIVAGGTSSNRLPVTAGVIGPNCGACSVVPQAVAGFVSEFSSDGTTLRWATYLPVSAIAPYAAVSIMGLGLDPAGNVILGGSTSNGLAVTPGALQTAFPGSTTNIDFAGFVMKLDPTAQRTLFSTYFGREDQSWAFNMSGLAVSPQGTVWIAGASLIDGLPVPVGTVVLGEDYIAELSADGSTLVRIFTAPKGVTEYGIALSAAGSFTTLGQSGALLTAIPGQGPSLVGMGNSAGSLGSKSVAPYELVSIYGAGLGPQNSAMGQAVNGVIPSSLGGTQVLFDGIPAPLLYAGPSQINAIVPGAIFGRASTAVRVVTPSGTLDGPAMLVKPSQPGVFLTSPLDNDLLAPAAAALNQDGSVNSRLHPAVLGSIVTVWASGGGLSTSLLADGAVRTGTLGRPTLPVTVFTSPVIGIGLWGGEASQSGPASLEILYAGDAPEMVAGVTQVNFRLPDHVDADLTNTGFSLRIGEVLSDTFTIYLKVRQ